MKRIFAIVLSIGSVALSGGDGPTGPNAKITAVVAKHASQEKYAKADFATNWVKGSPIHQPVAVNDRIETKQAVKVEVDQAVGVSNFDYDVLLGAPLGTTESGEGWVIGYSDSPPFFRLQNGWIFLWHIMPMATTNWVSTGGSGTTYIIWRVDANLQRVIFLKGASVKLWSPPNVPYNPGVTHRVELTTPDTFVDVGANNSLSSPQDVNTNGPVLQFVNKVKAIGLAAGWDE